MFLPLILLVTFCSFHGSDAIANPGPTCDVGEQERVHGGLCSTGKCQDYCARKYGAELVGSTCVDHPGKPNRECICKLKCCNSGCWGDPHCWTCDGVKFGYQGMKKHYVLKPIQAYRTLPYFTISQVNRVWEKGPMAILDVSEVIVKDWSLNVELKVPDPGTSQYILKANDKVVSIPYRFVEYDEYREHFLSVDFGDAAKTIVILTTSFGLRITYSTKGSGTGMYSDISIDTPRHPELKDQSHGLLGRWNGNPDDDAVDANGVKQPLDDRFSWAFGDSWIVPGGRTKTPQCVRDEAKEKDKKKTDEVDPKVKARAEKLCKKALESPELTGCAKKIGRVVPLIKNCITDLIYMENERKREQYIDDLIATFVSKCKGKNIGEGAAVGLAV